MNRRSVLAETPTALNGFLVEMAASYHPALDAIREFESHVQSAVEHCLSQHLPVFGRALGKRVSRNSIKPYYYDDGCYRQVGAKAMFGEEGGFWVHVSWEKNDREGIDASLVCTLWFKSKPTAAAFWDAMARGRYSKANHDANNIWFQEPIAPAEFTRLDERLQELAAEWGQALAKVGPLRELAEVG